MDDKYVLMKTNDPRAKKIAEALANPTCKKILDYLADVKEASEKDLADALEMKLNTLEYNLKKLLETGLVEKTKNFFWSRKGKKIAMFKLANKHIIISPKREEPDMKAIKAILPAIIGVALIALIFILTLNPSNDPITLKNDSMNNFQSLDEIQQFIKDNKIEQENEYLIEDRAMGGLKTFATTAAPQATTESDSGTSNQKASDFSETNNQVTGVDEADTVKNDGKYIYVKSQNKIVILNAYPAEDMEILSQINFTENLIELFINEDKLIAFTNVYSGPIYRCLAIGCPEPDYEESRTKIYVYNIKDRKNPELETNYSVSGNYFSSRMIGTYVYTITNQYLYNDQIIPLLEKDGETFPMKPEDIYYYPVKDYSFQNTVISAVSLEDKEISAKSVLSGSTQNIYVSQNNIYTTFTKYPRWYNNAGEDKVESTIIQKISIDKDKIEPIATGQVPGHILNQFSMDEHKNNFRIATTIGEVWNSNEPSTNNLYVLDEEMETIGELEELAPGEKIYSVRFMGDRGYIVTFKKVDPLFVIDLKEPTNPTVLGKLKIPGYSDYLHPYDENHIIGIGKDTVEASSEDTDRRQLDFAWYQGVKMAIFDVSDVENPIELHKVVIGDRGTDSEALHNHKAFLFDKDKELLIIPMTIAEIQGEKSYDNQYGQQVFQGALVYNINLKNGFEEKGRITHYTDEDLLKMGNYFYGNKQISRSLYMDDTLYTISQATIKANELDTIDEINKVDLPIEEPKYRYYEDDIAIIPATR